MTEYLKERGLFAFVNEYVNRKNIPIRTLLLAFGLMLVSPASLHSIVLSSTLTEICTPHSQPTYPTLINSECSKLLVPECKLGFCCSPFFEEPHLTLDCPISSP